VSRKKLTWNLQRSNSQADWIKAEKPLVTIVEVTSQAPKKKHLSPSTRKRNSQRLKQWKAKRNQAVVNIKVHTEAQTDNINTQIDDTTQTDQQNSHDLDHNTQPRVLQKRERSTQSRNYIKGYQVSK
jgi:ribosome-binding ATPase YchF (GTP1/OBG family)